MVALLGHLLPQPPTPAPVLDGGLAASVPNALGLLRAAPRALVLLGSGASAGYGVPINLASSTETQPLARYGPVRRAAVAAPEHGLYTDLKAVLGCLGHPAAVVSTNIDGLGCRAGLAELQLHGTTARLQCAPCGRIWPTPAEWPPADCDRCGGRPLYNLPTNTLNEEDVVWDLIEEDRGRATDFLAGAAGAPLCVLAIGIATHLHSLTPELRLIIEARASRGDSTSVVWLNMAPAGELGAGSGAMEVLGDAAETVRRLRLRAEAAGARGPAVWQQCADGAQGARARLPPPLFS